MPLKETEPRLDEVEVEDGGLAERAERVLLAHRPRFLASLARRTGSREQAEDVLQAAYARALEKGAPDDEDEGIVAWFHGVLRNAWIDELRRRGAERRAFERHGHESGDALDVELEDAICACVGELVSTLKPEYAELLRAVDMEGRSVADVARASGITPNNAGVRLHRARQALRRQLVRSCGACAEHGCLDCGCHGARPSLALAPRT